ncbi:MAG: Na+/H+ antiporter NhaC family protein, partial [Phycisphaerae bacterium]|nr:Na+/H+ antiporter NhaC family protein [Phycisphaerae bacterium]
WLERRRFVNSPRRAGLLVFVLGLVIFVESNITILVGGAVGRPLFDRFRLSRERLALLVDSLSAPVCMLIPLNAWGALVISLLSQAGAQAPVAMLLSAVPMLFYCFAVIVLAGLVALGRFIVGPLRHAEQRTRQGQLLWPGAQPLIDPDILSPPVTERIPPRALNMVLPIATMVLAMPVALWITGQGDLRKGSGSTSVLWAVLLALATAWVLLRVQRAFSIHELVQLGLKGAGGLVNMALILILALALASVANQLGTGRYVAQSTAGVFPPWIFLPLVFVVSAFVSFCTGTSWGTFALFVPIVVPAAAAMGLSPAPFVAAALSGGVFGDHASPISDTSIIASMASAADHVDHIRTQLPYALIAAAVTTVAYAVAGALL